MNSYNRMAISFRNMPPAVLENCIADVLADKDPHFRTGTIG